MPPCITFIPTNNTFVVLDMSVLIAPSSPFIELNVSV